MRGAMPWVRLEQKTLKPVTETEKEVYMRGAKIPVINDSLPGLVEPEYMTQAELLQRLEDERKLAAVQALHESGVKNPVVYEMEPVDSRTDEEAADDMVMRYKKQGVSCSARVMAFDGTKYVVAYA